jgi:hypothetical protein
MKMRLRTVCMTPVHADGNRAKPGVEPCTRTRGSIHAGVHRITGNGVHGFRFNRERCTPSPCTSKSKWSEKGVPPVVGFCQLWSVRQKRELLL